MNQFMMIFRKDKSMPQPSPEQMQASVKLWQDWIGGIAAQGKLVGTEALGFEGKLLKSDGSVTDGPYAEIKEIVGGYLTCKADSLDEAVSLADGCPMFAMGGTVEVRSVMDIPKS